MGFPRDYLEFTIWYLHRKGYITRADNSEFTLTAEGVDFVETKRVSIPVLNKLLTDGSEPLTGARGGQDLDLAGTGVIVPIDRRGNSADRRKRPDRRKQA